MTSQDETFYGIGFRIGENFEGKWFDIGLEPDALKKGWYLPTESALFMFRENRLNSNFDSFVCS